MQKHVFRRNMWHTRSQMLEMESKGVIGIFTPRFLSNISIVKQTNKKRDKWVCPIINPTRNKPLAAIQAFQDGVSLIRELRQGSLMIRLELKDAYFQSQSVHQTDTSFSSSGGIRSGKLKCFLSAFLPHSGASGNC